MNTRALHTEKLIGTLLLALVSLIGLQSCNNSKVSASGNSAYSNPDSIPFSKEQLETMLRFTYSNFYHTVPASDLAAIQNAADDKKARDAYETAIDTFVDSGLMQKRWKDYAFTALGVGSTGGSAFTRYPANLWAKVLLSGDKISEFILADYAVDDNGNQISQDNSVPTNIQAGYATLRVWSEAYVNQFKFKAIRELTDFNLCDTAPYTKVQLFHWTQEQINTKYTESGGIKCYECHKDMNPRRYAWHLFDQNGHYNAGITQGNNQYGQEINDGSGGSLDPRNPADGTPMVEATAIATMYKLTDGGATLDSPRAFALEISKNERYPRCMVERFLSVFMNAPEGHPGTGYVDPNNFSGSAAQVKFLDRWTASFNDAGQIPKAWFKEFLKSSDYLIIGYTPNG